MDLISAAVIFGLLLNFTLIVLISVRHRQEHATLLLFLGVIALIQVESFLNRSGFIVYVPFLINISIPLLFLTGPLLLSYSRKMSTRQRVSWMHFAPFAIYSLYFLMFFAQPADFKIAVTMQTFHPSVEVHRVGPSFDFDPLDIQGLVVVELMSLHMMIYGVMSLMEAFKSADMLKKRWSSFLSLVMITGSLILFFSQGGVINGYVFLKTPFSHYVPDLWITGAMYAIVFFLLLNPGVFKSSSRYNKSALPVDFRKTNLEKIRSVMANERPYREPGFSVEALSIKTGVTKHHISQILNEELKLTFYEFVHNHRIEEAKKLLKSDENIKIEQLAYELGYKSKATFFSAFKKATDLTPTQYKTAE